MFEITCIFCYVNFEDLKTVSSRYYKVFWGTKVCKISKI